MVKIGMMSALLGLLGASARGSNGSGGPNRSYGRPYQEPKYTAERNDPCPCGSGKKFKKCCINVKGGGND